MTEQQVGMLDEALNRLRRQNAKKELGKKPKIPGH
jgi:hypothetical protein